MVETYFQEGYLYQFEQHATTQAKLAANVRAVLLWQGLSCLRFRRKEVGGPAQRGWRVKGKKMHVSVDVRVASSRQNGSVQQNTPSPISRAKDGRAHAHAGSPVMCDRKEGGQRAVARNCFYLHAAINSVSGLPSEASLFPHNATAMSGSPLALSRAARAVAAAERAASSIDLFLTIDFRACCDYQPHRTPIVVQVNDACNGVCVCVCRLCNVRVMVRCRS